MNCPTSGAGFLKIPEPKLTTVQTPILPFGSSFTYVLFSTRVDTSP